MNDVNMAHTPALEAACVRCLFKKQMDRYPVGAAQTDVVAYLRGLGRLMAAVSDYTTGPEMMDGIVRLRAEIFGEAGRALDRESEACKPFFNTLMMEHCAAEGLTETIRRAADPLRLVLGYAMIGNYIDFGAMSRVDTDTLRGLLAGADDCVPPDSPVYAAFRADLATASRLVYLCDNCGEIVLDKLFLEALVRACPALDVQVLVRGGPVLNDATMEDVRMVGLDHLPGVRVMGNGDDLAGTSLPRISSEARAALAGADIILSKGQGNYETLRGCGLNIYYAFLCKCDLFATRFGVPLYTGMLVRERDGEMRDHPEAIAQKEAKPCI